jgi:hypothetical protein
MRIKLLLLAGAFFASSACGALAEPIAYKFVVQGGTATNLPGFGTLIGYTATLNGEPLVTAADNDVITFTFTADTSTVKTWFLETPDGETTLAGGYLNSVGTASFSIVNNNTMQVVAKGTFLPSDNMFVSADNVNGGVGLGSNFVPFGDPNFPGDAAYPIGITFNRGGEFTTLQDPGGIVGTGSTSCPGFPGPCSVPPGVAWPALATSVGELVIGGPDDTSSREGNFVLDSLTVVTPPPTPVPEPSTWAMLLLGFAGLGYAGYRKAQPGVIARI